MRQSVKNIREFQHKKWMLLLLAQIIVLGICALSMRNSGREYSVAVQALSEQEAKQIAEENDVDLTAQNAQIPAYRTEEITLPRGVYDLVLSYQASKDLDNTVEVCSDKAAHSALRTNVTPLYAGKTQTGYQFWVMSRTDGIYTLANRGLDNDLTVTGCTYVKTNILERTTLILFLAVFLFLDLGIWFVRKYPFASNRENRMIAAALLGMMILSSWILTMDGVLSGADTVFHWMRIEGVKDGLLSGQFPVRLQPNWLQGHGYATSIFYCDFFLYFPAVLRMIGFSLQQSYAAYKVLINVLTILVAYYSFGKIFQDKRLGLFGSFLYTFTSTRMLYLYSVDGVGQFTAYAFLPLVAYGLWNILTGDIQSKEYRFSWLPLTLGLSAIIESHVLTCEITGFFIILVCLICIKRVFRRQTFAALCKTVLATLVLNAWFLIPMIDYARSMSFAILAGGATQRKIQGFGLYLTQIFELFPQNATYSSQLADAGEVGEISYGLGIGMVLVLFLGIYLIWCYNRKMPQLSGRIRKLGVFSLAFIALSIFMASIYFPWDFIAAKSNFAGRFIAALQFPFRFRVITDIFLTLMGCWCICMLRAREQREKKQLTAVLAAVIITAGTLVSVTYFTDMMLQSGGILKIYDEECIGNGYVSGGEYLLLGTDVSKLTYHDPVCAAGVSVSDYRKEYCNVTMNCSNSTDAQSYVELPLLYYKGYTAQAEDGRTLLVACGDNNVVRVLLPADFTGKVKVAFVEPWYWRGAELISLLTIAGICIMQLRRRRK